MTSFWALTKFLTSGNRFPQAYSPMATGIETTGALSGLPFAPCGFTFPAESKIHHGLVQACLARANPRHVVTLGNLRRGVPEDRGNLFDAHTGEQRVLSARLRKMDWLGQKP
jgi:hypothetical protein